MDLIEASKSVLYWTAEIKRSDVGQFTWRTGDMEAKMAKITALIPAAGYSSRMGVFKPLLPLKSSLVIERPVKAFRQAGIEDIRVIIGYKGDLLFPVLGRMGIRAITNTDFNNGMYSSIRAGVETLEEDIDAFFLLPGDYPMVDFITINRMMLEYEKRKRDIIYPCFQGKRGHPPLISSKLRAAILNEEPEGGLKALLENKAADTYDICVNDPGIHMDIDIKEDYQRALMEDYVNFPSTSECLDILKYMNISDEIQLHSLEVARAAVTIAENLNSRGCYLQLGLVEAGALLHDIAKGNPKHAWLGRKAVLCLGYPEVAEIVGSHMEPLNDTYNVINEAGIVFLADKLVKGCTTVCLEERYNDALSKYGSGNDILEHINRRFEKARHIKGIVDMALGFSVENLVCSNTMKGALL